MQPGDLRSTPLIAGKLGSPGLQLPAWWAGAVRFMLIPMSKWVRDFINLRLGIDPTPEPPKRRYGRGARPPEPDRTLPFNRRIPHLRVHLAADGRIAKVLQSALGPQDTSEAWWRDVLNDPRAGMAHWVVSNVRRNRAKSLALLWQIFWGHGFPNQFFCDSWAVGRWRGRPCLAERRIGEANLAVG